MAFDHVFDWRGNLMAYFKQFFTIVAHVITTLYSIAQPHVPIAITRQLVIAAETERNCTLAS
jgi:hypothetical protein